MPLVSPHDPDGPSAQTIGIGIAVAGETDPTQQLNLAQPSGRALDVGFEQVNRLAELLALRHRASE